MANSPRNLQVKLMRQLDEEDKREDELEDTYLFAATLITCIKLEWMLELHTKAQHQSYLCRPDLLPNPHTATSWQILQEGHNDRAYIVTMEIDIRTFELILSSGFKQRWEKSTIDHTNISLAGVSRPHCQFLDAAGGLGLVLYWLSLIMHKITLQQIFALIPSTVNRYIAFSLRILLKTLKDIPQANISWPDQVTKYNEFEKLSEIVISHHSLLQGAFGSIDGLNLPCQV
ncbi:hypothetical protein QCA50_010959 [Cerrena zonata]|uniref:Uncharacterized protein n=1 Tax=Cerrena zonata TaxID=2478898 RepID=A0AAW0G3P4_9APHY